MAASRRLVATLMCALTATVLLSAATATPGAATPPTVPPSGPATFDATSNRSLVARGVGRSDSLPVSAADQARLARLRAAARGSVKASGRRDGKFGFLRAARGGDLLPGVTATRPEKAQAFLTEYAELLGAPSDQLRLSGSRTDRDGSSYSFTQQYVGLPVWGAQVRVQVTAAGAVTAGNGYLLPHLAETELAGAGPAPGIDATEAERRAIAEVRTDPPDTADGPAPAPSDLTAAPARLMIYPLGAVRGEPAVPVLAWQTDVSGPGGIAEHLILAADSGKLLNRFSTITTALDRQLATPVELLWQEGDSWPGSLSGEQQRVLMTTAETYWLFANTWSLDGPAGTGAQFQALEDTANPRVPCPNAAWTSGMLIYCPGMGVDDVIAHEWSHAYTAAATDLIYQWQPGALIEGYSDIWGETVDLINHREDAEEGDVDAVRIARCASASPRTPEVSILSPAAIAGDCVAAGASFGAQLTATGVTGPAWMAQDVDEDGADPYQTATDGCSAYTQPAPEPGVIAVVDRGGCTSAQKAARAQAAGAAALLIINNTNTVFPLSGSDAAIAIPAASLSASDGAIIRTTAAAEPVTLRLRANQSATDATTRWLVGEDLASGPARDLWRPTCQGDPGSVVDAQYYCDYTDNGGVHTNSTVISHGYSLLADGGTYGGVTVPGIGLAKAAAIHYRAQQFYATALSGFADHADALESACTSLVGTAVPQLAVSAQATPATAGTVTSADCAAVTAMASAVALRSQPTRCGFGPMLVQLPGAPCGPGYASVTLLKEDFTDGLAGWTTSDRIAYPQGTTWPWARTGTSPGAHGPAAYARATNHGLCTGGLNDVSSRNLLIAPPLVVPAGGAAPQLRFEHYVATETGIDGGNVKIRQVGDDAWLTVPAYAYVTNAPPRRLVGSATNSNPLAGQPAFSGTDSGSNTGSWGTSVIDLRQAGIDPEQPFQFAFDFGRDGCHGVEGWYVDNVTVAACGAAVSLGITQSPSPAAYGRVTKLTVKVSRVGTTGSPPTGRVRVSVGGQSYVGSVTAGTASVSVPTVAVGSVPATVAYLPDGGFAPATRPITISVVKARPALSAFLKAGTGRAGRPAIIISQVTAPGVTVTGKVRVYRGTRLLGKGRLDSHGRLRITVRRQLPAGKLRVTVKYGGSAAVAKAKRTIRIR